jgi:hypothetical protein
VKYVGLDWAYRTARWCALAPGGEIAGEGRIAADRDGLARLVLELGDEVKACLEMMSGALWVRDELVACVCVLNSVRVLSLEPSAVFVGLRGVANNTMSFARPLMLRPLMLFHARA